MGAHFCGKTARESKLEHGAGHSCCSRREMRGSSPKEWHLVNQGTQQGTDVSLHSAVAVSLCLHLQLPAACLCSVLCRDPESIPIFPALPELVMLHCSVAPAVTFKHAISQLSQSTAHTRCPLHSISDSGYRQKEKTHSKLCFLFPMQKR